MAYGNRDDIDLGKMSYSIGDGSHSSVITNIDFGRQDDDGSLNEEQG
jgi:hypothetical protein